MYRKLRCFGAILGVLSLWITGPIWAQQGPYTMMDWVTVNVTAAPIMAGQSFGEVVVGQDNSVTVGGRLALLPLAGSGPGTVFAVAAPDARSTVLMQQVPQPQGWSSRLAAVPVDATQPIFALAPSDHDIWDFAGPVRWTQNGSYAAVVYRRDEFESELLLISLQDARGFLLQANRPDQLSFCQDVRHLGNGLHAVICGHLECPGGGLSCGMATIADAGNSLIAFRLPPTASDPALIPVTSSGPMTATADCSDPTARLSKDDILGQFEGAALDTREGAGRYVLRRYGAYDRARDAGTLVSTSDYGGSWIDLQQSYRVREGQLCSANLNGTNSYCEYVKRCDPDGKGIRVVLLDDRDQISVQFDVQVPLLAQPAQVSFQAPAGTIYVQVASRKEVSDALAFASQLGAGARVFQASNGWYAIIASQLTAAEYSGGIVNLIQSNGWPSDSLLTRGDTFVKEITVPAVSIAPAATPGAPSGNAVAKSAFAAYQARNGDAFVARLIEQTRWVNSAEQSVYLGLLTKAMITRDPDMTDLRKLSILLAVMDDLAKQAGGDGDLIRAMNYVRNTKQGPHPSRAEVRHPTSGWLEASPSAKEFHVVKISDPALVEKYNHPSGEEAVFLLDLATGIWNPMNDGTNDATFNFVVQSWNPNDFWQHMVLDVVPWMIYGVSSDDQTTFAERIEAFEKSGVVDKAAQIYGAISDPTGTIAQTIGALPPNSQMTGLLNALQAARQTP